MSWRFWVTVWSRGVERDSVLAWNDGERWLWVAILNDGDELLFVFFLVLVQVMDECLEVVRFWW